VRDFRYSAEQDKSGFDWKELPRQHLVRDLLGSVQARVCSAETSAKTKLTGSDSVDHLERRAERACKAGRGLISGGPNEIFPPRYIALRLNVRHCMRFTNLFVRK
jgi:hypothetical protein